MLVIHQECSQTTQDTSGPQQDGGYYSWKDYGPDMQEFTLFGWLPTGLTIFNFPSNLTGPDL